LTGRGGVLDVQLVAGPGAWLAGRDTRAWGYNGTSPGPTLRLRPGDLLRVRLVNALDQPTNLHTHGLHVSPAGNSDNPFVTVAPGGSFDYAIRIPADHPAGTFWYHPHHHGNVADQIFAGLVGAIVIEGGPELPVTDDRILLVTDTTLDGSGSVVPASPADNVLGREGDLVLVNGQHRPTIAMSPSAVERWRVVNGCASRVLSVRLDGHRLTQIALDGIPLPAPVDQDHLVLAPGGRADVLVRPAGAGTYALVADPYPRGMAMGGRAMGGARRAATVVLATVSVTGRAGSAPLLPAILPAPAVPSGPVSASRELTLTGGMGMMGFAIDGRTFRPDRDDITVRLGSVEDWTVVNASPVAHPFHLHAWRVHVLAASAGAPPTGVLQDVVLVPARGWARLRIPFTDFVGRTVFHCHILDHEDRGMMGTINVVAENG
ncbi:MAG TPA: multicopper oxidase family protein, partial [Micromonosporaceae bacterium]